MVTLHIFLVRKDLIMKKKFLAYLMIQCFCFTACSIKQKDEIPTLNHNITPTVTTEVSIIPTILEPEITPTTGIVLIENITPTSAPAQETSIIKMEVVEKLYDTYGEMDEEKEVYLLSYNKDDHTIKVQNIEWLTPWSKDDELRIQELLDDNKVPEDIWSYEYYIYYVEEDTATYKLSDDVRIILSEEVNKSGYQEYTNFPQIEEKLLVSIYIKSESIYLIYETYTP